MSALKTQLTPAQIAAFNEQYRVVRIKPFNQAKGHLRINYGIGGHVFRGGVNPAWSQVTIDQANELAEAHQHSSDPNSPKVFDVCTYEEYRRIDSLERKVKLGVASRSEAAELTGEQELIDHTDESKPKVSFSGVKPVDKAFVEPKGQAVRSGSGDLTSEELKAGETKPGPQHSAHPNRKAVANAQNKKK